MLQVRCCYLYLRRPSKLQKWKIVEHLAKHLKQICIELLVFFTELNLESVTSHPCFLHHNCRKWVRPIRAEIICWILRGWIGTLFEDFTDNESVCGGGYQERKRKSQTEVLVGLQRQTSVFFTLMCVHETWVELYWHIFSNSLYSSNFWIYGNKNHIFVV